MKKIYKYSFSRHTLSLTTIYLAIFLALGIGLYFLYEGGYLSAWFFSFIVALIALMSLSIPRRILVDDEGLHILCLLEKSRKGQNLRFRMAEFRRNHRYL